MKQNNIGTAATLIIFSTFAAAVITVLLLGVSAYRNINITSRAGYDERVSLSFIWTKARTWDSASGMYVDDFYGQRALFIDEIIGGQTFHTIIYYYDGWMRELFIEAGFDFHPRDGARISRVVSLDFEEFENGLIKAFAGDEFVLISPRSDAGGAGGAIR